MQTNVSGVAQKATMSPAPTAIPDPGLGATAPNTGTPAQQQLQQFNAHPNLGGPKKLKPQPGSAKNPIVPSAPDVEPDLTVTDSPVNKAANKANEEATRIKQTGGLLVAVVILIILIWLLIPTASGYTRLMLVWNTLLGRTKLVVPSNPAGPNETQGQGPSYDQINQTQLGLTNNLQPMVGTAPDLSLLF